MVHLWVLNIPRAMAYGISQSYGFSLPTKFVDGQKLWVITDYGLPELWVKTEVTVPYIVENPVLCKSLGTTLTCS